MLLTIAAASVLLLSSAAKADDPADLFDLQALDANELSRTVYFNSTYLAYGVAVGAVLLIITAIGLYLYDYYFVTSRSDPVAPDQYYNPYADQAQYANYAYANQQQTYRSAQNGFFEGMNIVQWISMLQDVYEKFDYNDLDCQKRLICEVMSEPDYYGTVAKKFKTGFQYAKYLEVLDLPDDMRELLDEYMDANARADQQKTCDEFFTCPYSIKDSMKRNIADTNNL